MLLLLGFDIIRRRDKRQHSKGGSFFHGLIIISNYIILICNEIHQIWCTLVVTMEINQILKKIQPFSFPNDEELKNK